MEQAKDKHQKPRSLSWIAPFAVVLISLVAAILIHRHVDGISHRLEPVETAPSLLRHAILSDGRRLELHDSGDGVLRAGEALRLFVEGHGYLGGQQIDSSGQTPIAAHLHVLDGDLAAVAVGDRSGQWNISVFSPMPLGTTSAAGRPMFLLELDTQPTAFTVLNGGNSDNHLLVGDAMGRIWWAEQNNFGSALEVYRHDTWIRFLRTHVSDNGPHLTSISADGVVAKHEIRSDDYALVLRTLEANRDYRLHDAPKRVEIVENFKPAVVFDMGGKFDRGYNEGVWNGVKKFIDETGVEVMEFEVLNEAQRENAMRRMIERGATTVLGVGFAQADAIAAVAAENPDTQFGIIDVFWLDQPNIQQYAFKEHEGSYLAGVAAALTSQTGKVGFIGGMDIPLIRKYACGYVQGAKEAKSSIEVIQNMTGTTPAAWNDPEKGAELTLGQISRGADVIYHAAGGTGVGVIHAAADAGKLAIGVETNENGIAPGSVLTSIMKRVDVAAYQFLKEGMSGGFKAGVVTLGLAENGIDWAQDEYNKDVVTDDVRIAIEQAMDDIVSGKVIVHDYESDSACPHG